MEVGRTAADIISILVDSGFRFFLLVRIGEVFRAWVYQEARIRIS